MAGNYGATQYKQMSITTASRGQILLMLYEGAIQNVKKATLAIEKNDVTAKGQAIGKTHDIINELLNTLNHDIGGKVAQDLERLYNFMIEQLLKANLENSLERLSTVEKLLVTLLEGWRVAVGEYNKQAAQQTK